MWVTENARETAAAVERQAADHARIGALSVGPQSRGAHILAYVADEGGREAHSLIGTAGEIIDKLRSLRACGVSYVLLNSRSDLDNFRRFAGQVMPAMS